MKARRTFLLLIVADLLSVSGTRLSTIAIPWLVLTSTGSPALTGIAGMMEMLPYVAAKALCGPLIDRYGAKRIAVSCDILSASIIALVPLADLLGRLSIEVLFPIVFVMGTLRGPSDAAKQSLVPDIADAADLPLERVTGAMTAIERLSLTAGAAAAGFLLAAVGPAFALIVNALSFAAAAVLIYKALPAADRLSMQSGLKPKAYLAELAQGWRFLRADTVLLSITSMIAAANLLDQAFYSVLLPSWLKAAGHGPEWLGILLGVASGSSALGAVTASAIGDRMPRLIVYIVAFFLAGCPRFFVLAAHEPLPVILGVFAVAGFASGFLNPILSAVMFEHIPKPMRGRITAMSGALFWSLIPFGGLFAAALISASNLHEAVLIAGAAYLVPTLLPLAFKSFRGLKRPDAIATSEP